jgi:hypothetical protein
MEGTLYVLALVVVMIVFQERIAPHLRQNARAVPSRDLAFFGLSLSFAFWARTEGILLAVLSVLYLAIAVARSSSSTRVGRVLRVALLTGGTFALGVAPWFAFSLLTTGSLGQKSGAMKMLWASGDYGALAWWERTLVLTIFARMVVFGRADAMLFLVNQNSQRLSSWRKLLCCCARDAGVRTIQQQKLLGRQTKTPLRLCGASLAAWADAHLLLLSGCVYGCVRCSPRVVLGAGGTHLFHFVYGVRPCACDARVGAIFERAL